MPTIPNTCNGCSNMPPNVPICTESPSGLYTPNSKFMFFFIGRDVSIDTRRRQEHHSSDCVVQRYHLRHVRHGGTQNCHRMQYPYGKLYHVIPTLPDSVPNHGCAGIWDQTASTPTPSSTNAMNIAPCAVPASRSLSRDTSHSHRSPCHTFTPLSHSLQFLDELMQHPSFGDQLKAPSVSMGATPLYMHGAFEAMTRPNLPKPMSELVPTSNSLLHVNDKALSYTLRIQLIYEGEMD